MKFSIIIATYNAESYLSRALDSVKNSASDSYELIIVDGGSKDKTLDIIKNYGNIVTKWISEPDKGIYDAWNKGIRLATGDWVMFLGSDDQLLGDAIDKYRNFILTHPQKDDLMFVSSRMQMVDMSGTPIRVKGWAWEWPKFLRETTIAHPGALHSRELFSTYGVFDSTYRSAGDFELLLRPKDQLRTGFMNEVTVIMQEGGISDGLIGIKEHCAAAIKTGGYHPILAYQNAFWVYSKFTIRKTLRKFGINAYLKK